MLTDACMQSLDGVQVWRGSIGFELSSDEQGHVSGVCVVGGNFGNVTDYVGCLANEIQRHAVVPPNLKSVSWTLTYVCE